VSADAARLRFEYEWEPGEGVRSPELAATWCRLEIWVGSDCVSRVDDRESGSNRRSLYCSLYPLAEWIAYNWWLIQADVRPTALHPHRWSFSQLRSDQAHKHTWLRHHNLRAAGDGFLWPNVTIVPEGGHTRIVWVADDDPPIAWPSHFTTSGESLVDGGTVRRALAELVESVLTRLAERGITDSTLLREWRANDELSDDEREFCLATARLGFDPYSTAPEFAEELVRVSEQFQGELFGEFLDAVDPALLGPGADWVVASLADIRSTTTLPADDRISEVRAAVDRVAANGAPRPWTIGYHQAASAREALELDRTQPVMPEHLMTIVPSTEVESALQGLGGSSERHAPTLVLGASARIDTTKRFAAARALWHFAAQPAREAFLLTPTRTDVRKIERAFAAELLAPATGIREQLGREPATATDDDLDAAADHYGVSPLLIRHQVENQLLEA